MDDIRRPQHLKRRDYAIPASRPPVHPHSQPQPHHPVAAHPPAPTYHPVAPAAQPHYHTQPPAPAIHHTPPQPTVTTHEPARPHHHPVPARAKKFRLSGRYLSLAAGALLAIAAIFGAGYLLRGSNDSKGIPANITRQVNYDLYFPSPMPSGYTYMKDTATFQIGQVYYKFANGKKRVTVTEQPMPSNKPDLSLMSGLTQFKSPVGTAAVGTELGESTAVVLTPTTVVTMHSVGGVTINDLQQTVNNLKDIGQNKDHK